MLSEANTFRNEQNLYCARISPVPDLVYRPVWSVMIPSYNCAKYLRETLTSVLAQDLGPEVMQIEVIDDHSTLEDPAAVVEELGRGRVGFYQQSQNVGHIKNFQTCLERSRGKLIHLLHDDDCVRSGFYRKMQRAFEENSEIGAAFCRHIFIDEYSHWQYISQLEQPESGVLNNWLEKIAVQQRIQTPSIVVRRDVYERLGGFDTRLSSCEDWEMWVRIAKKYSMWYEVEPLALYRIRSNSNTESHMNTGKEIQNMRQAIGIMKGYLPTDCADTLSKTALENYALYALNQSHMFSSRGSTITAIKLIREALLCNSSLNIICPALKLSTKLIWLAVLAKLRSYLGDNTVKL
ncbi:MAG: glycosyltransferase [Gloeocapsa sp. UFS-A4-WI-NPMV-4B04]|jgi:glycosyltransferase involved in cell wall biosynthesis|nr:glycosyltransferase [Gloeocapsa sp. UFS-A4-WI-NPMV-4B04]